MTPNQRKIVKAHIQAWKDNIWDITTSKDAGHMTEELREGKTHKGLWDSIVENKVSITGQLMMSNRVTGHMSQVAEKNIKAGFESVLTLLKIT